jgi:acyl-CoA thioesterase-1
LGSAPLKAIALVLTALTLSCRGASTPEPAGSRETPEPQSTAAAADTRPVILFLGDSLTAGYGLDPGEAFPALVQARLDEAGLRYRVVNAGVSGETSAGALRRLDWLLKQPVAVVVVETGANDGLRGQDPETTRQNIQDILDRIREVSPAPTVVLVGMEALPNYGAPYRKQFRALYPDLAKKNGVALVPFLLDGVAGIPALNLPDGVHPNPEGQKRVAETVWKTLRPLLE